MSSSSVQLILLLLLGRKLGSSLLEPPSASSVSVFMLRGARGVDCVFTGRSLQKSLISKRNKSLTLEVPLCSAGYPLPLTSTFLPNLLKLYSVVLRSTLYEKHLECYKKPDF